MYLPPTLQCQKCILCSSFPILLCAIIRKKSIVKIYDWFFDCLHISFHCFPLKIPDNASLFLHTYAGRLLLKVRPNPHTAPSTELPWKCWFSASAFPPAVHESFLQIQCQFLCIKSVCRVLFQHICCQIQNVNVVGKRNLHTRTFGICWTKLTESIQIDSNENIVIFQTLFNIW